MRILMTSFYMPSESKIGVGHQVHALANAMVGLGHEVTVATPCKESPGALYQTFTVNVSAPLRTFRWAFELRRLDFSKFDVLHAHGDDYWLWRRRADAHIRTMHGSCLEEAFRVPGLKEKVRMLALGVGELLATVVADETLLVSKNTGRFMPWIKTVVPNGVDRVALSSDPQEKVHTPEVLFVGTFKNRKRGWLLAEAFVTEVLPRLPDARLRMVCSDAPELPGVEVLGRLSDEELAACYRRANVFCLPSTYEGFGIPYVEAMAASCAVVATRNPGAVELSDGGRTIRIAEDHELGLTLLTLLEDRTQREQLASAGLQFSAQFGLAQVAQRYVEIYASVMTRRARGRHR